VNNAAGCHESYLHKDEHTNEDVDPLAMELASSLTDGRYRYTWYGGRAEGAEEFYDHSLDPLEHRNLAGNPSYREIMAQFRQHLPVRNEPDSPKNGSADGDKKVMRTTGKANKAK
jgi:hypothetical protein